MFKKDSVLHRINRIEGQIQGVRKMYKLGRSCTDIVQQVQAARAALGKLAGILLTDEAKRCADAGDLKKLEKIVTKTFKII